MANLTYRTPTQVPPGSTTVKSTALTYEELDGNFKSLDVDIQAAKDKAEFSNRLLTVTGTNTLVGTSVPLSTAYTAGHVYLFVAVGDNTGAVTVNINGLGVRNVTKSGTVALSPLDIKTGQVYTLVYDGTRFQLSGAVDTSVVDEILAEIADLASLTPAAGKTPIANASGLIDPLWIGKLLVREDIGTRPHHLALHQHLGGMAYMQPDAVTIAGGTGLFTGSLGFTSGAGGTVTQATNRNTTVSINKLCGSITLATEAGNTATPKLFVVQNDKVSASDVVHIVVAESSNVYEAKVRRVLNGAFHVRLETTDGGLTDAPVLNFAVIKSTTV